MSDPKVDMTTLECITGGSIDNVLKTLPRMGRVMVIAKTDRGVTHERVGPVDAVVVVPEGLRILGACHDGLVDQSALVKMQIDSSSAMRDKVYLHLNFLDEADNVVLAVVGMDGTDPMDKALEEFTRTPLPAKEKPAFNRADAPEVLETDPAMIVLKELCERGDDVIITAQTAGLKQVWQGQIESVKPAMGFVNVMTSDFHLHLKAGKHSILDHRTGTQYRT